MFIDNLLMQATRPEVSVSKSSILKYPEAESYIEQKFIRVNKAGLVKPTGKFLEEKQNLLYNYEIEDISFSLLTWMWVSIKVKFTNKIALTVNFPKNKIECYIGSVKCNIDVKEFFKKKISFKELKKKAPKNIFEFKDVYKLIKELYK